MDNIKISTIAPIRAPQLITRARNEFRRNIKGYPEAALLLYGNDNEIETYNLSPKKAIIKAIAANAAIAVFSLVDFYSIYHKGCSEDVSACIYSLVNVTFSRYGNMASISSIAVITKVNFPEK